MAETVVIKAVATARLTTHLTDKQVLDALSEFDMREAAPPPVFAADLEAAREMYSLTCKLSISSSASSFSTALWRFLACSSGKTGDSIEWINCSASKHWRGIPMTGRFPFAADLDPQIASSHLRPCR